GKAPPRRAIPKYEHAPVDEGCAEQGAENGRREDERRPPRDVRADDRERGRRQPQLERGPEVIPVEADRLRDELADRALGRRQRDRTKLRHREDGSAAMRPARRKGGGPRRASRRSAP